MSVVRKLDLDAVGTSASLLCAIHCAVMPLVATLLPFIGLGFLVDERTDWAIFGFIATVGVVSLGLGFRKHRDQRVLWLLSLGLGLLALGHLAEERAPLPAIAIIVIGGLLVAFSHWVNRGLCHACPVCETHSH
jgi:hypothetical protein